MTAELKKLPTYNELISMDLINSKENDFQVLLNQEPPATWIQANKLANNSRYIPIDKVEYLLTRLFIKWWVDVIDYKIIANSVSVHIRLNYVSPITGENLHQDGLGAAPLQTDKDKGAIDFNFIKNAAVQMALPAAESYAIKDAAEKIGRLFGKDLNRMDLMNYDNLAGRMEDNDTELIKQITEGLESVNDLEELDKYYTQLTNDKIKFTTLINKMFHNRKTKLES